jgi:hypothetical protein
MPLHLHKRKESLLNGLINQNRVIFLASASKSAGQPCAQSPPPPPLLKLA